MNADFKNQKAILQEYINQFYVENFEDIEDDTNKAVALQTIEKSRNWIYKGKLGYIVDNDGYVHYFLIIENFPKEIRDQIKYGKGEKKYSDYVNCIDVWGITENLDVYYCKNGQNSIEGTELGKLSQENGEDEVFKAGSGFAKKIKGNDTDGVTKADLRGIGSFTIDASTGVTNLNNMYNFPDLTELRIENVNLTSLDGIEYITKLSRLYITNSTIESYKSLGKIPEQISYLFLQNITNEEVDKFCSYENGVGCDKNKSNGADFTNLVYFGIYGELHFDVDYVYDRSVGETVNSACKHSSLDDISNLSNLSKTTKERITNLFLNNNSLANIDNLWEFKNVERLRIEGNKLVNLNGLYNKEEKQGMTKLKYLHAYSNLLGTNEKDGLNIENDGIAVLSDTSYDESGGTYTFKARFEALLILNLGQNNLKHLDYLCKNINLLKFYFSGITDLNLNGIQNILGILEMENIKYACDEYVKNYVSTYSKKINSVLLNNKTMKISEFKAFFEGRENYLKQLDVSNLKLTTESGIELTNSTEPTYDSVINEVFSGLVKVEGFYFNSSNLKTIGFTKNMNNLYQVDLRGTMVADLSNLVSLPNLASLLIDYSGINVANEVKTGEKTAEITAVEKLFNVMYGRPLTSTFTKFACPGIILCSTNLVNQLSKSTNIEKFYSFGDQLPTGYLGSGNVVYDLSHTKITNCFLFGSEGTTGSVTFKFPSSIKEIYFKNSKNARVSGKYKIDSDNAKTLVNLEKIDAFISNWDDIMTIATSVSQLDTLIYYTMFYNDDWSLQNYAEILSKIGLSYLDIHGWNAVSNSNPMKYENLKDISKITSLTNLKLYNFGNLSSFSFINSLVNLQKLNLSLTGLNSLSFIRNLPMLQELVVNTNTGLVLKGFDENGLQVDNLELLKSAFNTGVLRTVDISSSGITAEEIASSGIKQLQWTSFKS